MSGSTNTHSKLSPSGAKCWASCSSSVKYIEENASRIPKEEESVYAAEGTQAHDYCEEILLKALELEMSSKKFEDNFGLTGLHNVPDDFRPHVKMYVSECLSHVQYGVSEVFVEAKVPLYYRLDDTGTVDFACINPKTIIVRDFKYGAGVKVDAEGNEQSAIYGRSIVDDQDVFYDFADEMMVSIGIVQPRYRGDNPISTWDLSVGELRDFTKEIEDVAHAIQNGGETKFAPSEDACRWCPVKGFCVARLNQVLEILPDLNEEAFDTPDITTLSDAELVNIYKNGKEAAKFIADVGQYLEERGLSGDIAEGTKIVQGRQGNTAWTDKEEARKWLNNTQKLPLDDCMPRSIATPTQAAKLLKEKLKKTVTKNKFDSLTSRSEGKKVLALSTDKRPAIETAVDALPDLGDDDDCNLDDV